MVKRGLIVLLTINFIALWSFSWKRKEESDGITAPLLVKLDSSTIKENWMKTKPFRCPLSPLLPCLSIIANFILCTQGMDLMEWVLFLIYNLVGLLFYFMYGYHHSKMPSKVEKYNQRKMQFE